MTVEEYTVLVFYLSGVSGVYKPVSLSRKVIIKMWSQTSTISIIWELIKLQILGPHSKSIEL